MKTLFFECNMGAAGDMLMSALYEICEQKDVFLETMNRVFAPYHITLSAEAITKCGILGTSLHVSIAGEEELPEGHHTHEDAQHTHTNAQHSHEDAHADVKHSHEDTHADTQHSHEHTHRHTSYASILSEIDALDLPEKVRTDAKAIYHLLGEAEARVHGSTLEQIHFHEVGSLDALADITGCALLLSMLAPDEILCSPIHVGSGFVRCAHGVLPVPAPATAELLKGIPFYTGAVASELCTPTGAAILKYYVSRFCSMPSLQTEAVGYGMGHKDFEIANCVRVFSGTPFKENTSAPSAESPESTDEYGFPDDDSVLCISCNLDDMTGEALGLATEILMAAGALDVFTIPIQMKKSRPGILLSCICKPEEKDKFTGLFFLHTSTRGVRYQTYSRAKLESTFETRPTAYGDIRIKKSSGYGIEKEKAEFEDLKSVILKNHCSVSFEELNRKILHQ